MASGKLYAPEEGIRIKNPLDHGFVLSKVMTVTKKESNISHPTIVKSLFPRIFQEYSEVDYCTLIWESNSLIR